MLGKSILLASSCLLLPAGVSAGAEIQSQSLLVAIEDGGAVEINAQTGQILARFDTGPNAFGAIYTKQGDRGFVTDKTTGELLELSLPEQTVTRRLAVGSLPQQPDIKADGTLFIPLAGEAAVAVVSTASGLTLVEKVTTGAGTKPHIVALSPEEDLLWVTVQGIDPKVIAFSVAGSKLTLLKEYRYNIVPRVVDAAQNGRAFFTGHHSTGMHFVDANADVAATIFMEQPGSFSEAAKQIEGVSVNETGNLVGMTHEGKKSAVIIRNSNGAFALQCSIEGLADKPYWITLDSLDQVAFVSIPGAGLVEAYDIATCQQKPLWSVQVGGKAKRLATK